MSEEKVKGPLSRASTSLAVAYKSASLTVDEIRRCETRDSTRAVVARTASPV